MTAIPNKMRAISTGAIVGARPFSHRERSARFGLRFCVTRKPAAAALPPAGRLDEEAPATTYRELRRRSASFPPNERLRLALRHDFEQVANLPLLEEGMTQGKLRLDLVAVPPALPLARHVALVD
jgi:hypothetical protein